MPSSSPKNHLSTHDATNLQPEQAAPNKQQAHRSHHTSLPTARGFREPTLSPARNNPPRQLHPHRPGSPATPHPPLHNSFTVTHLYSVPEADFAFGFHWNQILRCSIAPPGEHPPLYNGPPNNMDKKRTRRTAQREADYPIETFLTHRHISRIKNLEHIE